METLGADPLGVARCHRSRRCWRLRREWIAGFAVAFLAAGSAAHAGDLSGVARIIDGDTIALGETRIRLQGIDAPKSDQVCLDSHGARWTCGIEARDRLSEHIGGRALDCTPTGQDVYHRVLAICRLGAQDLNAWMVQQGWALAFVKFSSAYVREENPRVTRSGGCGPALSSPHGTGVIVTGKR